MSQFPTRGGNSGVPILLSDQQGFARRWFAPYLQAATRARQSPKQIAFSLARTHVRYMAQRRLITVGVPRHDVHCRQMIDRQTVHAR